MIFQKHLKKKKKKKHSFKALFANLSDNGHNNNNNGEKESAKNVAPPIVRTATAPAAMTTSAEETELRRRYAILVNGHYSGDRSITIRALAYNYCSKSTLNYSNIVTNSLFWQLCYSPNRNAVSQSVVSDQGV